MDNFKLYAEYYDLLYRDKDYSGEASYVDKLIRSLDPNAKTIFSLGCGTGRYEVEFARLGYQVTGIDVSREMVELAQKQSISEGCHFAVGDICTYRAGNTYDAVISLFHVMDYQTTNANLAAAFETAAVHLNQGGVFVFDFWYGPAVLSDPPTIRVRRLNDNVLNITRIAEPVMHHDRNVVEVNYEIQMQSKQADCFETIRETHSMRYLFLPEIAQYASCAGLDLRAVYAWMKETDLDNGSWYGVAVCGLSPQC